MTLLFQKEVAEVRTHISIAILTAYLADCGPCQYPILFQAVGDGWQAMRGNLSIRHTREILRATP